MDDLDTVVDQWVTLVADQREHGTHLLPEENRETARDVLSQYVATDKLLVARVGGVVAGFVMFHVETGLYEQDVTRGVVDNVYVGPAYRGAGVGSALLDEAESTLAARGADVVSLSVMASNVRARDLYESRGYEAQRVVMERDVDSKNDTHSKEDG
ncbi:GNAT family N-acetyltransferase [Halospeciosus flavus]|uniref:GNAT family N-acetyltransferase n=1 Tax=Halospeciosus flavus TaxID=3032283 RepID=A0ABD5Z2E1_9EURY|nr:GNAT family N-acetyltransferase [Halospeciosus flavus]